MSELVTHVLGNIRNRLLDLTRRNRLLNYKESSKSIRIVDELPDEVYRILVTSGKAMELIFDSPCSLLKMLKPSNYR